MALRSLAESPEFALPEGAFDVRSWDVTTRVDEQTVGEVDDVLLNEDGDPQYLDVDLGIFKKHVLLPLGHARVDEAADVVWVPGMTRDQFERIPEYTHDLATITPEYETRLAEAYAGAYAGEQYYARPEYSAERPRIAGAAGIAEGQLASLYDLDEFEVAHGDPDPRGWEVIASDGKAVGTISDLVIDTSALKVRYLDCDLDEDALGLEDRDRHILIPTGYARLDENREAVVVDAISSSNIEALPAFLGLPLEREFEEDVHTGFMASLPRERRYEHPRYSTERFYRPREEGSGETAEPGLTRSGEALDARTEHELRVENRRPGQGERVDEPRPVERREELDADLRRERLQSERSGEEQEWLREVEQEDRIDRTRPAERPEDLEPDRGRERLQGERSGEQDEWLHEVDQEEDWGGMEERGRDRER